jgi:hypothetical protein
LALEVARRLMADSDEPKLIQLYGYENHNRNGYHYFGRHGGTLRTTQDNRFKVFEQQLSELGKIMKKEGFGIVNMTPDSDLRCFDRG